MARSLFPEAGGEPSVVAGEVPLDSAHDELLLDIADRAIVDGLRNARSAVTLPRDLPPELRRAVGAFVSLHVHGELNGCIGSIRTDEPLGASVARHAWSAAFADPRLPALRRADYEHLEIEISILSPLTPVAAPSRGALLESLEPGVDGLLIAAGPHQAVFLPTVWTQLPTADVFVAHLLRKAGLDPSSWPDGVQAHRFTARQLTRTAR